MQNSTTQQTHNLSRLLQSIESEIRRPEPVLLFNEEEAVLSKFLEGFLAPRLQECAKSDTDQQNQPAAAGVPSVILFTPEHPDGPVPALKEALAALFADYDFSPIENKPFSEWPQFIGQIMENELPVNGRRFLIVDGFGELKMSFERRPYQIVLGQISKIDGIGVVVAAGTESPERSPMNWRRINLATGEVFEASAAEFMPVNPIAQQAAKLGPEPQSPARSIRNSRLIWAPLTAVAAAIVFVLVMYQDAGQLGQNIVEERRSAPLAIASEPRSEDSLPVPSSRSDLGEEFEKTTPIEPAVIAQSPEAPETPAIVEEAEIPVTSIVMVPAKPTQLVETPQTPEIEEAADEAEYVAAVNSSPESREVEAVIPPADLLPVSGDLARTEVKLIEEMIKPRLEPSPLPSPETTLAPEPEPTPEPLTVAKFVRQLPDPHPANIGQQLRDSLDAIRAADCDRDLTEVEKWLTSLAEVDPNSALAPHLATQVARMLANEADDANAENLAPKAVQWLEIATNSHACPHAMVDLAAACLAGWGMPEGQRDPQRAKLLAWKARNRQSADGAWILAVTDLFGLGQNEPDYESAARLFNVAIELGSQNAYRDAARAWDLEWTPDSNRDWAMRLYEEGADRGDRFCMKRLAHLYRAGEGICSIDLDESKRWSEAASAAAEDTWIQRRVREIAPPEFYGETD